MNMAILCVLTVLCISLFAILILISTTIYTFGRSINKLGSTLDFISKFVINTNIDSDFESLNKIIDESITLYKINELEYKENLYMTEQMQIDMIKWVLSDVLKIIPEITMDKLILSYGKEKSEDIILRKIKYEVMAYTVDINGSYKEK